MGLVISLIGALLIILGLVGLFRPIPQLKLTTRGRAILAVLAGLVLVFLGGPPPPEGGPDVAGPGAPGPGAPGVAGDPASRMVAAGQGGARPHAANEGRPNQTRQDMPWLPTDVPAQQLRFLASLEDARGTLCQQIKDPAVANWIGTIKAMSADRQGRGMVAVDIGNRVLLTTAIEPKNEAEADSLVPRTSQLYADVSRFQTGDPVQLSGRFVPGEGSCAKDVGSPAEPAFLFKFTSMARF